MKPTIQSLDRFKNYLNERKELLKINDEVTIKGKVLQIDSDGDVFVGVEGLGEYWFNKDFVKKCLAKPAEDKQIKGAENK